VSQERELALVRGLELAKRVLEIAAAGGHPLLLSGPAAVGKSLIARCAQDILPPAVEERIVTARQATPRAVEAALGGGDAVVILEEQPRFPPRALAALTEAAGRRHPSLLLIATMRTCACGRHEWQPEGCLCTKRELRRHGGRVAEIKRLFQLRIELAPVALADLRRGASEPSADVARRVRAARRRQEERGALNAGAEPPSLEHDFTDKKLSSHLLGRACEVLGLPRENTLRVARTIADLAGKAKVDIGHLAEAIAYRPCGEMLQEKRPRHTIGRDLKVQLSEPLRPQQGRKRREEVTCERADRRRADGELDEESPHPFLLRL
jgi:magnesium chelatase family protein